VAPGRGVGAGAEETGGHEHQHEGRDDPDQRGAGPRKVRTRVETGPEDVHAISAGGTKDVVLPDRTEAKRAFLHALHLSEKHSRRYNSGVSEPGTAKTASALPDEPGVYIFRNARDRILYVGKARSLRRRVGSYFHRGPTDAKTSALLSEQKSLETIVTRTELEALLLENTLIKKHRPRYNVCLRDDKTYPYIKITTGEAWPRALVTRRVLDDGHSYFGPFWGGLARRTMKMITRHFQIRTCRIEIDGKLPRPCLYYDLHACLGPCVAGLTTKEKYDEAVADVLLFLRGKSAELEKSLRRKMDAASEAEQFEMAGAYRDALRTARDVAERQVVQRLSGEDVDVWAFHEEGGDAAVQILIVRGGNVLDRREYFFEKVPDARADSVLSALIPQFYAQTTFLPDEVQVSADLEDAGLLEDFLSDRKGARVRIRRPRRGPARSRMEIAEANARNRHRARFRAGRTAEEEGVERLSRLLEIREAARRIEGFDISHIQGSDSYASMVVFENGKPRRGDYRLFRIASQSLLAPDDFASMAEAVHRRYARVQAEGGPPPDLILVDGGRGQLAAAVTALDRLGLSVPCVGLAKKEEEIFVPGRPDPIRLARRDPALQLVQRVRDEAHRFAIARHRKTRVRRSLTTRLTEIPGVGPTRAKALLREFGSLDEIRGAPAERLSRVVGGKTAEAVRSHLGSA
jgi:excinuclease ABC subunit C